MGLPGVKVITLLIGFFPHWGEYPMYPWIKGLPCSYITRFPNQQLHVFAENFIPSQVTQ